MSNPHSISDLAYIALGSNLGDSADIFIQATERLRQFSPLPLLKSSLWRTEPVDCPPGSPPFLNAMIGLKPDPAETPLSLLSKLQTLEQEFGRERKGTRNAPRTLDLDLIAFGTCTCSEARLILPHPRAHQRAFVLAPLAEIAPELILPGQHRTVRELLGDLESATAIRRVDSKQ